MSLALFIEVVVQAHVDEAPDVRHHFHVHHLPHCGIDLVQSCVPKLYQQLEIFQH